EHIILVIVALDEAVARRVHADLANDAFGLDGRRHRQVHILAIEPGQPITAAVGLFDGPLVQQLFQQAPQAMARLVVEAHPSGQVLGAQSARVGLADQLQYKFSFHISSNQSKVQSRTSKAGRLASPTVSLRTFNLQLSTFNYFSACRAL